jgi:hypothetical protein
VTAVVAYTQAVAKRQQAIRSLLVPNCFNIAICVAGGRRMRIRAVTLRSQP